MKKSSPALSKNQLQVLDVIWTSGNRGSSTQEIWEALKMKRRIARTTVATIVSRLLRRGWLMRRKKEDIYHYFPTRRRSEVVSQLTRDFTDRVFRGSASLLVQSLLGSQKISPKELQSIRVLLKKGRASR